MDEGDHRLAVDLRASLGKELAEVDAAAVDVVEVVLDAAEIGHIVDTGQET
jgi:hypothetical protein